MILQFQDGLGWKGPENSSHPIPRTGTPCTTPGCSKPIQPGMGILHLPIPLFFHAPPTPNPSSSRLEIKAQGWGDYPYAKIMLEHPFYLGKLLWRGEQGCGAEPRGVVMQGRDEWNLSLLNSPAPQQATQFPLIWDRENH